MYKSVLNPQYKKLLADLKTKISTTQIQAARSVNSSLILMYFEIGQMIIKNFDEKKWGSKIIESLSKDLSKTFPEMKGFSKRNLEYMRLFAETWTKPLILQQLVAKLPWGHNIVLMTQLESESERVWYAKQCIENGWSRNILVLQIQKQLFQSIKSKNKTHNFKNTLPKTQSDLAQNILKDPYSFDFLSLGVEADERSVEKSLVDHIQKFLLELGAGFAFIGRQFHLEVDGEDFYIDLLFYHTKLHCYIVVELKIGDFKPGHVGQLNFYLSAIDEKLKTDVDKPTIGLLLCQSKNKIIAEYALKNMSKPISIAEYKLHKVIPKEIKTVLPSIKDLELELNSANKRKKLK